MTVQKSTWRLIREYAMIFIALCPFALMVNWIFIPHQVVGGGLTGICSVIYFATEGVFMNAFPKYGGSIPVWLSTLVINTVLLLTAALTIGWRFCVRTLWGVLSLAFWYWLIPISQEPIVANPFLGGVLGGIVFGASLAIVLQNNGSSGGTDIIAMIVHHYKDISLGRVMFICDVLIILSAYILPIPEDIVGGNAILVYKIKRILYGVTLTVTYSATIDLLMWGVKKFMERSKK